MRMRDCYLDCHEAGLCCYLVINTENLLRPFVTYLLTLPRISVMSEYLIGNLVTELPSFFSRLFDYSDEHIGLAK
jgi:hypothetical protein